MSSGALRRPNLDQGPRFVVAVFSGFQGIRHYDYSHLEPQIDEVEAAVRRRA